MNRRDFIRNLAGAAAVCGIPLLRGKPAKQIGIDIATGPDRTAVMICERYYGDGGPYRVLKMWTADEKNNLMRKMVAFRREELETIRDKEMGDIIEQALWATHQPASPESVVLGRLFADKKVRIIDRSGILRKLPREVTA